MSARATVCFGGLLLGAAALGLAALPRCSDQSFIPADMAVDVELHDSLTPSPDWFKNACAPQPPAMVSGKVYAPNGVDPVAGASVHVPLALSPLPKTVQCESCAVKGRFASHIYSKADGSFVLPVPNGSFKLGIQKGHFRRVIDLTVPACAQVALTKDQTTLPGKNAQWSSLDEVPSIAVVSGAYDQMEKVLDKLGLQERTIYNGKDYGTGPESVQALLQNGGLMRSYHIILVNCGTKFEALVTSPGAARNNIREYVRQGGRLFVTDFSYDYVEQVFPELIDFEGSDSTPSSQPEEPNAAELGSCPGGTSCELWSVRATILDKDLKAWLGLAEIKALLSSGEVELTGFMTGWAVMKSVNEKVGGKVWVTAPMIWAGGTGVRPLTMTAEYRDTDGSGCGRVAFSSYHTHGAATELSPQERILEYLMLEIGACSNIE
jgi:hypothetical protein